MDKEWNLIRTIFGKRRNKYQEVSVIIGAIVMLVVVGLFVAIGRGWQDQLVASGFLSFLVSVACWLFKSESAVLLKSLVGNGKPDMCVHIEAVTWVRHSSKATIDIRIDGKQYTGEVGCSEQEETGKGATAEGKNRPGG